MVRDKILLFLLLLLTSCQTLQPHIEFYSTQNGDHSLLLMKYNYKYLYNNISTNSDYGEYETKGDTIILKPMVVLFDDYKPYDSKIFNENYEISKRIYVKGKKSIKDITLNFYEKDSLLCYQFSYESEPMKRIYNIRNWRSYVYDGGEIFLNNGKYKSYFRNYKKEKEKEDKR